MRLFRLGLVVALLAACGGRSPPVPPSSTTHPPGMPPRVVGSDLFVCLGSWAGYRHVVYAPNDSSKPTADIRPDRCFASLQDAEAAGFHLPPPPPGGMLIGTIYLVPADPPIAPVCEEAAGRLGFTIRCPTLIPGTADSLVDCDQSCVFFKSLVLHFTFSGPPGYVGIPGQNGNHLFVLESRAGNENEVEFLTCSEGRTATGPTVRGTGARWVSCPANGSGMNSGHVMLVWTLEGIRYAVSLHADTDLNRKIAMAVAERLVPVTG